MLDPALLRADVAVEGVADRHDRGAFHLRAHPVRIDHQAAIHRHIDAGDRHLAVIADHNLRDHRDISQEAAVHRDAAALPCRQLLTPATLCRNQVEDPAQPARVDRIDIERGAVVRIIDAHRP